MHLHVHSNFSFLDGGSHIEELVARAVEVGQSALALTDHDGLYGAVRFAKACARHDIKPIFGAEVQVESLLDHDRGRRGGAAGRPGGRSTTGGRPAPPRPAGAPAATGVAEPHHLVLLAETREGYANLCRLLSAAHLADPERAQPPLVTIHSLRTHATGLICLTGCRHGEVGYLVDAGRDDEALAALSRLREIFGPEHLYVELQYSGYEPHQEAHPGQHGTPAYQKVHIDGGRLRHRPAADPGSAALHSACSASSLALRHVPTAPSGLVTPCDHDPTAGTALHSSNFASWFAVKQSPTLSLSPQPSPRKHHPPVTVDHPDLPHGTPRRTASADSDVGFHRDGRPWHLSCLAYCTRLTRLANECGLRTVLTTNAHYAGPDGRALHLVCRAAGHDTPLSDYPESASGTRCLLPEVGLRRLVAPLLDSIAGDDLPAPIPTASGRRSAKMHSNRIATDIALSDDLAAAGPEHPGAILDPLATTAVIAARCNVDLDLDNFHFPQVTLPAGETAYSLLAKRCFSGIARRYRPVPPKAVELLEKELRVIQEMGFAHYFLVVHDIVRWARARGIACSGRGSAGNSIVCHALDITASEPIRHHLLFERFLNPNRREMPDIDIDFCSARRDEVIEYIYQTFGEENVAVVANVNTMGPRSAVRIVAEALGFAPTEIDALAKNVPRHGDAARIREYLAGAWPELRDSPLQDSAPPSVAPDGTPRPAGRYARFLDLVERLDGFPLHLGTHLGGFVIADRPLTHYAPLQYAAKQMAARDTSPPESERRSGRATQPPSAKRMVVTQFNKDDVAALGLVKMDILGLRTHSAVSECVHLIRQRTGRRIRPYELPPDNPAAYEIISNGGSIGLFQLESAGQRNLAGRLRERDFDDIIAAIALYRPGPLEAEMISPFIDRRWGIAPVTLPHPAMAEALADTYGVIVYQEQVLRIARDVAGFDLADADSLRRAMTRDRSRQQMAKIGKTFVARAVARGVPEDAAREVFRQLEGFAAYGFNKSHSVCFAVISYATAYLKARYPAEFLAAVLNNQPMGFYTPRTVLNDARRFGLEVRPLDINLSGRGFTVEDAVPPDVWGTATGAGDPAAALASGAPASGAATPYDPFAQAWTADRNWGLTEADLAGLEQEQNGEARSCPPRPDSAAPLGAGPAPCGELPPAGEPPPAEAGREAPPLPGDLTLPRAPHARGGVAPGACLAPSRGLAPDAGRALRVGFSYLKQMGGRALARIEEERRHGPFESFEDFYLRTRVDYPVAENLIRVGAFDSLEPDRTELLWRLPLLHDRLEALAGSSEGRRGQLRAFYCPPCRAGLEREWSIEDKVQAELELLGLTVTCHPLELYEKELRRMGVTMSYELPTLGDEVPVTVAGVYERAQNPWMRSGRRTMFLTLEDAYGLYECVCFESKLPQIAPVVARASYFLVRGRLQNNRKRGLAIVAEEVMDLEEVLARRRAGKPDAVPSSVPVTAGAPGSGRGRTARRAIPKKVG